MKIDTNNYADFLTTVKSISALDVVFFYDNTPSAFRLYAIAGGRRIVCQAIGLTSEPGSFSTDFPDAIELTDDFGMVS